LFFLSADSPPARRIYPTGRHQPNKLPRLICIIILSYHIPAFLSIPNPGNFMVNFTPASSFPAGDCYIQTIAQPLSQGLYEGIQ
jgi:hypothetical protein